MKPYIRCKACGYIMEASGLKDLCPACGIPKEIFEPYPKVISPRRKFILDQHFHPIILHFPQVFLVAALFLPLLSLMLADPLKGEILIVAKYSILALPFSVLGGLLTGLLDGKLRLKRYKTPLLIRKIIAGVTLQILTFLIFGVYLANGFTGNAICWIAGLSLLATGCAVFLGKIGATLFDAILPG